MNMRRFDNKENFFGSDEDMVNEFEGDNEGIEWSEGEQEIEENLWDDEAVVVKHTPLIFNPRMIFVSQLKAPVVKPVVEVKKVKVLPLTAAWATTAWRHAEPVKAALSSDEKRVFPTLSASITANPTTKSKPMAAFNKDKAREVTKEFRTPPVKVVSTPRPFAQIVCTRMCNSMQTEGKCRFGNNCKFAHSLKKLSPLACTRGNQCHRIIIQNDVCYKNKQGVSPCQFIHPRETKEDYGKRLNIA